MKLLKNKQNSGNKREEGDDIISFVPTFDSVTLMVVEVSLFVSVETREVKNSIKKVFRIKQKTCFFSLKTVLFVTIFSIFDLKS